MKALMLVNSILKMINMVNIMLYIIHSKTFKKVGLLIGQLKSSAQVYNMKNIETKSSWCFQWNFVCVFVISSTFMDFYLWDDFKTVCTGEF